MGQSARANHAGGYVTSPAKVAHGSTDRSRELALAAETIPPACDWALVCPDDQTALTEAPDALACPTCGRHYPIRDGIACFLAEPDTRYEGAYKNRVKYIPKRPGLVRELPLWLISNGYVWASREFVAAGAKALELGCAGGVAYFGTRYSVAGVDLSLSSLKLARVSYDICLQADVCHLPLADRSVDAVLSSYLWEHIAPGAKPILAREVFRVLRPGGHMVFVYDLETSNPAIAAMRRGRPDLYQSEFLDQDGHVGYQTPDANDDLFVQAGFEILRSRPLERTPFQTVSVYEKMARWPGWIGRAGRAMRIVGRRPIFYPYLAFLRVIDVTVGRLFPRDWGRIMITVAR